jgi:hypothetical protein
VRAGSAQAAGFGGEGTSLGVDGAEQACSALGVQLGAQPVHAGRVVDALGEAGRCALALSTLETPIGSELVDELGDVSLELPRCRRRRVLGQLVIE